ncbi:hypothetical protein CRENBAI_019330 [Crenichthys baileyi]|uniref:Uncharacterized protein n=1 Tax=Crenichthys baileyi TaxID=28760 RepID=A0AAV9QRN4_9TELE
MDPENRDLGTYPPPQAEARQRPGVQGPSSSHRERKLCSREFPAGTLSLRRRVEQFSLSEGRITGRHPRGYSSNVRFGQPTERGAPPHSYRGSLWMLYSTSSPRQLFLSTVHVRGCVVGRE